MATIRTWAAVAHQVKSTKTSGAFEGRIDFTFRRAELLRDLLGKEVALRKMIQGLLDYTAALLHLLEAHIISIQGIAA